MSKKIYITADQIQTPSCDVESQETAINWSRKDKIITIFTSDPTTVTKLKNIMLDDNSYKCFYYDTNIDRATNKPTCYTFECDRNQITFRKKSERKDYTDEERKAMAQRLNKNRN